jgi:hypothetical protein
MNKIDPILSPESQEIHKKYSKFYKLDQIYKAKKAYYSTGNIIMTDEEYDRLETSFKNVFGEGESNKYYCVGYDANKHHKIREYLLQFDIKCLKIAEDRGMECPELPEKIKSAYSVVAVSAAYSAYSVVAESDELNWQIDRVLEVLK